MSIIDELYMKRKNEQEKGHPFKQEVVSYLRQIGMAEIENYGDYFKCSKPVEKEVLFITVSKEEKDYETDKYWVVTISYLLENKETIYISELDGDFVQEINNLIDLVFCKHFGIK